ncbi:hypothetical protein ILYODFUR_016634 [Ilyodon furcidens]|uniref:Uncharacterized protein n=1 Tax=Ilyodon furcidens TaxID=33524 RepID=A0ABV0T8M1_9TELE
MGSVSECTTSIIVYLYVGCECFYVYKCGWECVIVTVCACLCDRLGLGLLPLLDQFRPPIRYGAYFLPATLPAGGWCLCLLVYWWFSVYGAGCFGVYWLTPGGCCRGLGLCLGSNVPRGLGSLGPWLLWRRRLPVGPVGSSMQLPGASALWLLVVHLGLSSLWQ